MVWVVCVVIVMLLVGSRSVFGVVGYCCVDFDLCWCLACFGWLRVRLFVFGSWLFSCGLC